MQRIRRWGSRYRIGAVKPASEIGIYRQGKRWFENRKSCLLDVVTVL